MITAVYKNRILSIKNPKINISGDYSRESEGNTDLEEIGVLNLVSLLAKNTDASNVRRCADRSAVATQCRARKKTKVAAP